MPGQDRPFDRTEFMTEAELAEHHERQRENSKAMAMLSEENRELVKRLEQKQEQAVLERCAAALWGGRGAGRRARGRCWRLSGRSSRPP